MPVNPKSLANILPHRWRKGQSGNPSGGKHGRRATERGKDGRKATDKRKKQSAIPTDVSIPSPAPTTAVPIPEDAKQIPGATILPGTGNARQQREQAARWGPGWDD